MTRVLVVDNEAAVSRMVCRALQRLGCLTVDAYDIASALAAVREFAPDLVISDVDMPRGSGYALTLAVHAIAPSLPVVLMSGHVDQSRIEEAHEAGAVDLYDKMDVAMLGAILDRVAVKAAS